MSTPVNEKRFRLLSAMAPTKIVDQPTDSKTAFASRLKEAIGASDIAGLTLTQQAAALEVSKGLLSQWLSGRQVPKLATLQKPCKRLNVSSLWLLENQGPRQSDADDLYGTQEQQQRESNRMDLQQQKAAYSKLLEDIPNTARMENLRDLVRKALDQGWIDSVPDVMMADWDAREKIAKLKKKPGPHDQ